MFICFSNPSGDPDINMRTLTFNWTEYSPENAAYLQIVSETVEMRQHLRAEHVAFWNGLVQTVTSRLQTTTTTTTTTREPGWSVTGWLCAIAVLGLVQLGVLVGVLCVVVRQKM